MEAITEPPAATTAAVVTTAELSPIEAAKLENLEIVIKDGLQSFLDVGRALLQIRDERLYRLTHGTFEAYCEAKWGISPRHANRLATAATITDGLGPIGPIAPTNESQVRPLAKLPVEERGAAWQEAVEASNGKPTAAVVEEAVKKRKAKPATIKAVEKRKAPQAKAKPDEEGLVDDDDGILDEVAAMLNRSVAAMNKATTTSKAIGAEPVKRKASGKRKWKDAPHGNCPASERGHEWSDEGVDCERCGEPRPQDDDEQKLYSMNDPRIEHRQRVAILFAVMSQPDLDHDFYHEMRRRFTCGINVDLEMVVGNALPDARWLDQACLQEQSTLRSLCDLLDSMNEGGAK